jgi:hypothetical protein
MQPRLLGDAAAYHPRAPLVAALMSLLTEIVFKIELTGADPRYGPGFDLCIAAWILLLVPIFVEAYGARKGHFTAPTSLPYATI